MLPLKMLGLLMHMFLLCDADSACPIDTLILDPSEVIEEYGGQVSVNCTSTTEEHEGMYWTDGVKKFGVEEDEAFVPWTVTLLDWHITAKCNIKLNASLECWKDLNIIAYKSPDTVIVYPLEHVNSLVEGKQYELQCDIFDVAPVQNLTVMWYKGEHIIKAVSFTNTTKTPVTVSSVLTVNASREDNKTEIRCVAQLDFGPHGPKPPAATGKYNFTVHYAPELNKSHDVVYVEEGKDVTLNCEAEGNPLPQFHWTRNGVNMTEAMNALTITQVNTSAIYNCTAANDLGRITKHIEVYVIKPTLTAPPVALPTPMASAPEAPSLTLTPAVLVVRFGDPALVNCNTSATDAAGMGWEARLGGTGLMPLPVVTWNIERLEDWTIVPICFITMKNGKQYSVFPDVTLYKTPDIVSVSMLTQGLMVEGTECQLRCDVLNVAPVQNLTVKWYRGNESMSQKTYKSTSKTPQNVFSDLRVNPKREDNGAIWWCNAELNLGPAGPKPIPTVSSKPYTTIVHYKPLPPDCPAHYVGVEHDFSLDMLPCKTDGNPQPTVHWYFEEKLISATKPLDRAHSGKYTVQAVNDLGGSNTSVDITIEYSPSFTCNDRYEVEEYGYHQVKCEPTGIPTPTVTWFKDGKEMASAQHWTKHDSGKYVLRATNRHGTVNHTIYLDVLFAPEFKDGNYSKEVTLGENMTLGCLAEGNPTPMLRWTYTHALNVRENTRERQSIVFVTGATSTNAGVYICVATNKVGSVSRSVTLTIKGTGFSKIGGLAYIWWLLIICLLICFLILIIILFNRRKKHGQYTFIPDNAKGSDIPLTTQSGEGRA